MLAEELSFLNELAEADQMSGAVLVAADDKPLFSKAYGLADREKKIPNRIDTRFNLGSMNKMFTGVAIAQLAQLGALSFNDPIGKYLPAFQGERVRETTLHQLLTHTSGLGNYMDDPRYAALKDHLRSVQEYLPLIASAPLQFEPGSRFLYSNSGYMLLGAVIEAVASQSYFDFVQRHIFDTAGMAGSGFYERDDPSPDIAHGYVAVRTGSRGTSSTEPVDAQLREDSRSYMSIKGGPAGGGYSTVGDMLKFSRALLDGKLLSREYTDIVTTGKVAMAGPGGTPSPARRYGYGFSDGEVEGVRTVGHNGGGPGVNAQLDIYPVSGYTMVILANYDGVLPLILSKIRRGIINTLPGHV